MKLLCGAVLLPVLLLAGCADKPKFGPVPGPSGFAAEPVTVGEAVLPVRLLPNPVQPAPEIVVAPKPEKLKPVAPVKPVPVVKPKPAPEVLVEPKPVEIAPVIVAAPIADPVPAPVSKPAPKSKPEAPKQFIVTPANPLEGKVTLANTNVGYAVLTFPVGKMAMLQQSLNVYRHGMKVGTVLVTGPSRDDNIAADITDGEAQSGDDVRNR